MTLVIFKAALHGHLRIGGLGFVTREWYDSTEALCAVTHDAYVSLHALHFLPVASTTP